jgi:DNA-binding LytR/AlgR family response regulator
MLKPFFIRQNGVLKSIDPKQVVYLRTQKNYTYVYLLNKTHYMVRSSLSAMMKKLPPDMFIKVHRSLAASVYFIDDIAKDHLIIRGKPEPIGRQYYKTAIEQLNVIE